jgi:hypothetical protein
MLGFTCGDQFKECKQEYNTNESFYFTKISSYLHNNQRLTTNNKMQEVREVECAVVVGIVAQMNLVDG